ncbi:type VI immunity family protein [Roseateles sp.]|uniref:type VI immunity family protein n=1 Tax=Roseateles sp. TaxID=1971397 RepID=UPI0039E87AC4
MDLSTLAVLHAGKLVALPTISICVYFSKPAHEIARPICDAMNAYEDLVGRDKLNQYSANSGEWRALARKKLEKDMAKLRDYPSDVLGFIFEYNSDDVIGRPGSYGAYIHIIEKFLESEPLATNFFRLDFDISFIQPDTVDRFVRWYGDLLEKLPFHSSHAGYAYKRLDCSKDKAATGVDRKISRYYGFDPGYEPLRDMMAGRTGNPQWLNAFDMTLVEQLGGEARIAKALPESRLTKLKNGLLVQGAPMPPVGDINRRAPDIGSIPEIARLFKPLRTPVSAFRGPVNAQEWLARYDELENRPWRPST